MKLLILALVAALLAIVLTVKVRHDNKLDASNFGISMVRIAPGSFEMGSLKWKNTVPIHHVTINYSFELGATNVTEAQWEAVMGYSHNTRGNCPNCPIENVKLEEVNRFIMQLNKATGKEYRLPSEAEWEYACRAGGNDEHCGESEAALTARTDFNPAPVARFTPNAWKLYDMGGSKLEWMQDCYRENYFNAPVDGSASDSMLDDPLNKPCYKRTLRGGYGEAAFRSSEDFFWTNMNYGFRIARTH